MYLTKWQKTFHLAQTCIITWGLSISNFELMQQFVHKIHKENLIFTVFYCIKLYSLTWQKVFIWHECVLSLWDCKCQISSQFGNFFHEIHQKKSIFRVLYSIKSYFLKWQKLFVFSEVCIINWGLSRANFKLMQRLIWELHVENPIFTVFYSIQKIFPTK